MNRKKNTQQSKYMWTVDSDAIHMAYNTHHKGILPTEGTDDIPQEHFKHLMNIFYRTKVAITEEKAKVIERQIEIRLMMSFVRMKEELHL